MNVCCYVLVISFRWCNEAKIFEVDRYKVAFPISASDPNLLELLVLGSLGENWRKFEVCGTSAFDLQSPELGQSGSKTTPRFPQVS